MVDRVRAKKQTEKRTDGVIKLRVDMLRKVQALKGWNNSKLARKMGVNRNMLYKALLPENNPYHVNIGPSFIAGALRAFPELTFEDLFYIEESRSESKNKKESAI